MYRLAAIVLVIVMAAGRAGRPAALQQQELTTFKTTTKLVVVDVFVRGKNGKAIDSLKKEDFTVLENGKAQTLTYFSSDPFQLSVAIVLDTGNHRRIARSQPPLVNEGISRHRQQPCSQRLFGGRAASCNALPPNNFKVG